MSITPQPPPPPQPTEAPGTVDEAQIVRRWLWRQLGGLARATVFLALGMALGLMLATRELQSVAHEVREEEGRYATILLEPNQGQDFVLGALALLLGAPAGAPQMLSGLTPPQPKWVLRGKETPMSSVANAQYSWVDLQTRQTQGPFRAQPMRASGQP